MKLIDALFSVFYRYHFPKSNKDIPFWRIPYEERKYFNIVKNDFLKNRIYIEDFISKFNNEYDIFLSGDSVILAKDINELDQESLGFKIAKSLNARILSFNCGAFSSLLYSYIFKNLPKMKYAKIFLLEFNLRSLSDEWYLRPSYQFESVRAISTSISLQKYITRNITDYILIAYYFKIKYSDTMLKQTRLYTDLVLKNTNMKYRKYLSLRTSFHYCFPEYYIKKRIIHLIKTIRILKEKNFIPYIFITPINYQSLIATQEIDIMKNNIKCVITHCEKAGALLKDFSCLIDGQGFTDAEHLRASSREYLAKKISEWIGITFKSANYTLDSYGIPNLICIRPEEMKATAEICQKI